MEEKKRNNRPVATVRLGFRERYDKSMSFYTATMLTTGARIHESRAVSGIQIFVDLFRRFWDSAFLGKKPPESMCFSTCTLYVLKLFFGPPSWISLQYRWYMLEEWPVGRFSNFRSGFPPKDEVRAATEH